MSRPVALVTGAGRGIGRAIALAFAAQGYAVGVNDIDAASAQAVAAEIVRQGNESLALAGDVSDPPTVARLVAETVATFGGLDALVNNAGIEPRASILAMDPAEWDEVQAVNLRGVFLGTQAAGRVMRATGHGSIVNISSIAGKATPLPMRSAYAASKAGVVGFTKEAAREFAAYGVRVNAVCPGVIATEMTRPSYRRGWPASPSVAWASRRTSPTSLSSSAPTRPPTSPARPFTSTGAG